MWKLINTSRDGDWFIGALNGRHLHIRWLTPIRMCRYDARGFRLSLLRILKPVNWWKVARLRENWELWWRFCDEQNHRCYCPVGTTFDAHVLICGWGCWIWYQNYTGAVPCPCDEAIEEMEAKSETSVSMIVGDTERKMDRIEVSDVDVPEDAGECMLTEQEKLVDKTAREIFPAWGEIHGGIRAKLHFAACSTGPDAERIRPAMQIMFRLITGAIMLIYTRDGDRIVCVASDAEVCEYAAAVAAGRDSIPVCRIACYVA